MASQLQIWNDACQRWQWICVHDTEEECEGGGVLGGCTDVTYEELVALIGADGLTCGSFYKITDFRTVHYMVDGDGNYIMDGEDIAIHTGELEPLVVLATSANTLSVDAYSPTYPTDNIKYDWDINNWLTLPHFFTDGGTPTGFTGIITRREDTVNVIHTNFDFREITYRKWSVEQEAWAAQEYDQGDLVQYTDNIIYVANQAVADTAQVETITLTGASGTANVTDAGGLTKLVPFCDDLPDTAADFVTSWTADYLAQDIDITSNGADIIFTAHTPGTSFTAPAIANVSGDLAGTVVETTANYSIATTPDSSDRFTSVIDITDDVFLSYSPTQSSIFCAILEDAIPVLDAEDYVDVKMFSSNDCSNILFDEWNTISYTTFGEGCSDNTFGEGCSDNTFGEGCSDNTFGTGCNSNTFGTGCVGNTFGTGCDSNTFGTGCNYNTFGTNCEANTFGEGCGANTFGAGCSENTFSDYAFNNRLENLINGQDYSASAQITDGSNIIHQLSNGDVYQTYIDSSGTPTIVITTDTIGASTP